MCLTGGCGSDYACVKLLMILKMLKCFGHNVHQSPKAVPVSSATRKACVCSHGNVLPQLRRDDSVQSSTAQAPSSLLFVPEAEAVGTFRCSDPAGVSCQWCSAVPGSLYKTD